ncbi:MAG: adenylosuccinate lyase [Desulfurococcaceae archaeon]|nr:adenylosuccinate lyase [Desulfurococcaceae archaeon]
MSLCPLEFRYGSNDMRVIFSRENIIKKMIEVELRLYKALEECGIVPKGYYEAFSKCVGSITVRPEEVDKREEVLGHDVVALLSILTDRCGDASRFLHYGATSNDVIDTVWGLLVRDALGLIKKKLVSSIRLLMRLTREYKDLIMVGRTHGQHALPITLGFKLANYVYELTRSLERLVDVESRVVRGKMAGAVGTMAGWRGKGLCVESVVMRELNLRPHEITTQVVPRDGFAELVSVIAILASQIERFGVEVRELMRPEILELAEGVGGRVGSSTMPHKANPVECEKISGLTRVLRGLVVPAIEDIVLWHERDLSNSSAERLLIPHTFMLIDEILDTFNEVLSNLKVYPENMIKNLKLSKGAIMSESLMLKLTDKGLSRYEAHRVVRELVTKALRSGSELIDVVLNEPEVLKYLSVDEVREALDYSKYLGNYNELIERTLKYAEEVIKSVST